MTGELLRTLRSQVANDQVSEALETVDDLEDAFVSDRARVEADDTFATAVRYRSDPGSSAAAAADSYFQAANDLEQRRIELNEAILGYLREETQPKQVVSRIDATLGAYDTLETESAALRDAANGVSVGAILHLEPIDDLRVPKGNSVAIATVLANLGTAETGSLELSADTDNTVSVELSPTSLDGLAPGEETPVGASFTGESAGTTRIRVAVSGDDAESSLVGIVVLDKADYVTEVLSNAERLLTDVDGRKGDDDDNQSLEGLRNRFEEIVRRLEQILDYMENDGKGNGKGIDNRITSVINRFESVVNTLENGVESPLDARVRSEYLRHCRESIDLLGSAIVAAE